MKTKTKQTFKVDGENLVRKFKELVKEGNVQKITINTNSRHTGTRCAGG